MNRPRRTYEDKVLIARLMAEASRPFDGPGIIDAMEFRREQYGLNDASWAQVLGWSRSHYAAFKAGKRYLSPLVMARAFALGVPAECLFQQEKPVSDQS